jgi:hypothetical protein
MNYPRSSLTALCRVSRSQVEINSDDNYCGQTRSGTALNALEQAVQVINKLDKFDLRDRTAPKLGLAAVPSSEATLSTPYVGFDFRSVIEPLIATDFEQVAAVVERMTAKEVAGVGRIEAAKLYLQKNPEKAAR